MDERAAAYRRWKQEGDFSLRKNQRRSLVRKNPGGQHQQQQNHCAQVLDDGTGACEHRAARTSPTEKELEQITPQIDETENGADEILRLLEPPDPRLRPVHERTREKEKESGDHGAILGGSSVARRNRSSRRAPSACSNRRRISSSVPSMTFRPLFKISTCEQISSTRCRRCELMTMAAPSRARFTIESFMRRMPSGSRPVSGSSKKMTLGEGRSPHAMASFCVMPRESSPGNELILSASSNSSSSSRPRRSTSAT